MIIAGHLPPVGAPRRVARSVIAAVLLLGSGATSPGAESGAGGFHIDPTLTATTEWWRLAASEARPRDGWIVLVELLLEVELPARPGTTQGIVVQPAWYESRDGEATFGAGNGIFGPVSSIAARRHTRVMNLHYRRTWHHDRNRVKIGQLRLDDDFMVSDYAGLFCNAAFGSLPTQVATTSIDRSGRTHAYPEFPLAAPGLWFGRQSPGGMLVQVGIYSGAVGEDVSSNHGFDWSRPVAADGIVFLEASVPGRRHRANTTRVGLSYHSGRHETYRATNADGLPSAARGLWNAYVIQDLVLVTNAADEPVFGVFARVGCSPARDRSVVTAYADAGGNWFGALPGRPDDALGVAIAHTHFGRPYRLHVGQRPSESLVELTYRARLASRLSAQADVQWIRPAAPAATRQFTVVYGLRAVVNF